MKFKSNFLKKLFVLLLLSAIIYGCGPKLYTPSEKNTASGKSVDDLLKGKSIYETKCARCHKLVKPSKYNATQWTGYLNKMQPKAKISDTERDLVYQYLINKPVKKGKI